jgi:hypothetical protein
VRLLVHIEQWIAQKALDRPCSMNAVVVGALDTKISLMFGETQNKRHAAAIEAAIDMAQLPSARQFSRSRATASVETFLSKTPSRADFVLLARVSMTKSPSRQMPHLPKPMGAWR